MQQEHVIPSAARHPRQGPVSLRNVLEFRLGYGKPKGSLRVEITSVDSCHSECSEESQPTPPGPPHYTTTPTRTLNFSATLKLVSQRH
jgi:hypothetical protein